MKNRSNKKTAVRLTVRDAKYLAAMLLGNAAAELDSHVVEAFPPRQVMRLGTMAGESRVPEKAKAFRSEFRIWDVLNEGLKLARRAAA